MLLPDIFGRSTGRNFADDWFAFPQVKSVFDNDSIFDSGFQSIAKTMKTDIEETDDKYAFSVEVPGFAKEDIALSLENGYLNIKAEKTENKEEKKLGKTIRKERYSGSVQRTFYVGDKVKEDEIKAKFENGVLKIDVPKAGEKEEEPKKLIEIN